ncbi:hypothetical protein ACWAT4_39145 [Bradyrhizobium manausense]
MSIAAYIVDSAPGFDALALPLRMPVHLVSVVMPAAFWIVVSAIFVDEFRLRWYHWVGGLALMGFALVDMFRHPMSVDVARTCLSVSLLLLGVWHVLSGRATDLVEKRRRLRVWYAMVTALYALFIIGSDWLWPGGLSAASLSLANAAGLTALIFLFAVLGTQASAETSLIPAPALARTLTSTLESQPATIPRNPPSAVLATEPNAAELAALRGLLDHDKVFREPDLSIATLSQKLDIPEYRLRHLINHQLGHRNFSAFVNGYRLAEAEAALGADPDHRARRRLRLDRALQPRLQGADRPDAVRVPARACRRRRRNLTDSRFWLAFCGNRPVLVEESARHRALSVRSIAPQASRLWTRG